MKVLERIKKGLSKFNKFLSLDIDDENEKDYPDDIRGELEASENGNLADLEQAQAQLWESRTTGRSQLASELRVDEDGMIKGSESKEQETGDITKTKVSKDKQPKQGNSGKGKERVD